MIDFRATETRLLLDPRLPRAVAEEAVRRVKTCDRPGRVWLMTSGSGDGPKLVGLRREALLASAAAVNAHLGATAVDVWLLALPTHHVGGLGILARAHVTGARVVAPFADRPWSPEGFLAAVRAEGCRLSALVPTQLFDLVEGGERCPPTLRAIVIGGDRLGEELHHRAREQGYPVLPSYGFTECSSQVATAALGDGVPDLRILSHVELRVSPSGRLAVRSPALLDGYLVEREGVVTFEDPKVDGWFETEDRGEVAGGVVRVAGREGTFVKISGEGVDLGRLAGVLLGLRREHLPDHDAVLIAIEDERRGRSIALVVERAAGEAAVRALREAYDAAVRPFERARQVLRVDAIPRSALGKLRLGELRSRLRDQAR